MSSVVFADACRSQAWTTFASAPGAMSSDAMKCRRSWKRKSWAVFLAADIALWRRVLAVPAGRGDATGLFVATVCGVVGLALLMVWLRERERSARCVDVVAEITGLTRQAASPCPRRGGGAARPVQASHVRDQRRPTSS